MLILLGVGQGTGAHKTGNQFYPNPQPHENVWFQRDRAVLSCLIDMQNLFLETNYSLHCIILSFFIYFLALFISLTTAKIKIERRK